MKVILYGLGAIILLYVCALIAELFGDILVLLFMVMVGCVIIMLFLWKQVRGK